MWRQLRTRWRRVSGKGRPMRLPTRPASIEELGDAALIGSAAGESDFGVQAGTAEQQGTRQAAGWIRGRRRNASDRCGRDTELATPFGPSIAAVHESGLSRSHATSLCLQCLLSHTSSIRKLQGRVSFGSRFPASPAMLHQVDGAYYERGDTQTRPMRDADVAERIRLRADRDRPIQSDLTAALAREEAGRPAVARASLHRHQANRRRHRTSFTGARKGEMNGSRSRTALCQPSGMLPPTPNRYWGILRSNVDANGKEIRWTGQLYQFRDIEFQESGGFCHLSYCPDWLKDRQQDVFPYSALLAGRESPSDRASSARSAPESDACGTSRALSPM